MMNRTVSEKVKLVGSIITGKIISVGPNERIDHSKMIDFVNIVNHRKAGIIEVVMITHKRNHQIAVGLFILVYVI